MVVLRYLAELLSEPLLLAMTLAVVALLSRMFLRCRGCTVLVVTAVAIAYLGSTGVVGELLLRPLERQYAPLPEAGTEAPPAYVVVLGSGYKPGTGWSITAELDNDGLARVVEGVRLQRSLNTSTLVLTGGLHSGGGAPAVGHAILARSLGVNDAAIKLLDQPTSTAEEAQAVAQTLGTTPFLLVTSAYHMPRAVRLMQEQGARPIPAPVGPRFPSATRWRFKSFLPSSIGLRDTERALHEYLALAAMSAGLQ